MRCLQGASTKSLAYYNSFENKIFNKKIFFKYEREARGPRAASAQREQGRRARSASGVIESERAAQAA